LKLAYFFIQICISHLHAVSKSTKVFLNTYSEFINEYAAN